MKKSLQLSMDLYYIGMILYIYGMKPYHICIKSYGVIVSHTVLCMMYQLCSERISTIDLHLIESKSTLYL